jgi:hypothetical protein
MSYLKILGARRKTKDLPGMEKLHLSEQQKALTRKGICIKCATAEATRTSYLCDDCQALDSIEDIRNELAALRRNILKKQSD